MTRQITTEEARAIVQHPASTLDEISAAGRILANSPFPSDRITGRRIMHELGYQITKAKPRNDLCRRLSDAPPDFDRMEWEEIARRRAGHQGRIRLALAVFLIGLVAALMIQAAWGKTARSLVIYEQIEAAR